MLDKERIIIKIDELNKYIGELNQIMPKDFAKYVGIEKKRSCERLLQLCIECILDICKLFIAGLRLGLPREETDLINKMKENNLISENMSSTLKEMRGFRNILIHEYAEVDDEIVFDVLQNSVKDFLKFKNEIFKALKKR